MKLQRPDVAIRNGRVDALLPGTPATPGYRK
jgi:hypothetical protein